MLDQDDRLVTRATIIIVAALWAFACVMANLGSFLQGHTPLGQLLTYIPSASSAIVINLLLLGFVGAVQPLPRLAQAVLVLVALALASVTQTGLDLLYVRTLALTAFPEWKTWALHFSAARISFIVILYTWTFFVSLVLVWASKLNDNSRISAARAAAFEAATYRAEAAALRLQLNPHFLFNTLNSIASLTVTGRIEQAEKMISLLADFLRASLTVDPSDLVSVSTEVANTLAYLRIAEVRFGDRLRVHTEISEAAGAMMVPNFTLQPLAENAIKYGVAPRRSPTTILLSAHVIDVDLVLTVSNEGAATGARETISP